MRGAECGCNSARGARGFQPGVQALAADIKVDLSREQVGRPPATFEPMVGTWLVARDGADNVIMVDGRPWVASKDNPTKLLIESARKLYGTSNEELMDNAKQFAYFPVAVLRSLDSFTNGAISVKFKTIAGDADRASGILFNVKPNGDWLAVRYNDTENNVALWEFHNGMRRNMRFSDRSKKFMLDRAAWHELKLTIDGADLKAWSNLELPNPKQKEPPARIELATEHATSGKHSLKITFAGGNWPAITTTQIPDDWTPYQTFKADVTVSRPCVVGFLAMQEQSKREQGWDAGISRWVTSSAAATCMAVG